MVRNRVSDFSSSPVEDVDEHAGSRASLRFVLRFWLYATRYKGLFSCAILALLAAAGATLAMPIAVGHVIDASVSGGGDRAVDGYFVILVVIAALLALASAARYYTVAWLSERVICDVRGEVLQHVLSLGQEFFDTTKTGDIVSRLTTDAEQIRVAIGSSVSVALRNVVLLIGSVAMMVVTAPVLSSLALAVIPFIILPILFLGRMVKRQAHRARECAAISIAQAAEAVERVRLIQAFNAEQEIHRSFSSSLEDAFEAVSVTMRTRAVLTAVAISIVLFGVIAVLWYGTLGVVEGEMSVGVLGQFVLYAILAAGAMGELSQMSGEIFQAAGAARHLAELLDHQPLVRSPQHPRPLTWPPRGRIEFRDVSFAFPAQPGQKVLESISFKVDDGENVGIVGSSGAGKSTLFDLLLRYYDPTAGEILIDGVPVREMDLSALRLMSSIVPQDAALFAMSIADNISFGRPGTGRDEIVKAAQVAQADGFISDLPNGYDTWVGRQGVTLSGGQRQRVAIARAILRDAPIFLLDESTNALDSENEAAVRRELGPVLSGRTVITITHRLSIVEKADRILVLDKGRVVEEGTHARLCENRGLYSRMVGLQQLGRE